MSKKRVLVVGDVMFDKKTVVETSRQAQEADIPVWDILKESMTFGGAGNVAENIAALGGEDIEVHLMGIFADYDSLNVSNSHLDFAPVGNSPISMIKHRIFCEEKIIARIDSMRKFDLFFVKQFEKEFENCLMDYDAVVVSDYDKGTITEKIVSHLSKIPLKIVDSKRQDLQIFSGFDILKVNNDEFSRQSQGYGNKPVESLFKHVVRTMGSDGSELRQYDPSKSKETRVSNFQQSYTYTVHFEVFPAEKVTAVDVTGCGDTHTAAMTVELLRGRDICSAVKFGNRCAAIAVSKCGTTIVRKQDLEGEEK